MDEPIDAKKLADRYPVLSEPRSELNGGTRCRYLGHVKAALKEVQAGGDVCGQGLRRQGGYVLVPPHFGKLVAQMPQHDVGQLIRSGDEPSSEIAEEDMGIDSHT